MSLKIVTATIAAILFLPTPMVVSDLHARELPSPSAELQEALTLSNALLPRFGRNPRDLKVVKVENLLFSNSDPPSTANWRFTYKERSLIPSGGKTLLGLGGELFIEVDLVNKKARLTGFGE